MSDRHGPVHASDPAAPVGIGQSVVTADRVSDLDVADDHAFVAAGEAGLYVFDVSDPAQPRKVANVDTYDIAWGQVSAACGVDHCRTGMVDNSEVTCSRPARRS
jgi:hypothetical protein